MTARAHYLTSLIGRPWSRERSCWHLVAEVQATLFARELPPVTPPAAPTWRWMMDTLATHPERARWREVAPPPVPGLITAPDGALVAMARADRAAHVGVWLAPERRIIHCDETFGVQADTPAALRAAGWNRLMYFEPAE